ncbi:CheR family methyltransferase [Lichenicoccus roseus]|uniref:protein-glutamate O-methyltransferase n=1 Tax=Lichenicoccus roseus TaxID=2683649 RepID=A0A5R9JAB4_9PROT|nr:protein-glutamate O-methyltransferase CheR [Lichenicoccus roseus]TLU73939.1 protein-glutamate O-methyltransferase CheR [Lichenicoccus roseus]
MTSFEEIATLVKSRSGLTLGPDKTYLLETRLEAIARRLGVAGYEALAPLLRHDRLLQAEVVEALTTNETLFFRDTRPFDHVRTVGVPRLLAGRPGNAPLRVWSAAASTGQEAYSLAMLFSEMGAALCGRAVQILGTDIARIPLARAREGLYSQFEVQRGLPARMLVKYFRKEDESWRLIKPIRDMVEFREWNLLSDAGSLGRFDIIFCRNVLIYFDPPTKSRVLEMLTARLVPGGLLFLGAAESVTGLTSSLRPVGGEHFVFEVPRVAATVG